MYQRIKLFVFCWILCPIVGLSSAHSVYKGIVTGSMVSIGLERYVSFSANPILFSVSITLALLFTVVFGIVPLLAVSTKVRDWRERRRFQRSLPDRPMIEPEGEHRRVMEDGGAPATSPERRYRFRTRT